jgi:hypothetical protein
MLLKLFVGFALILTVVLAGYHYTDKIIGTLEVVEISDSDVAKANGEINGEGEIVISDGDAKTGDGQRNNASGSRQDTPKLEEDGSQVLTMYDGYGNKTETRAFNNHSRLKMVVVRTDTRGLKRVFVYGHNGKVKSVPSNMIEKVLTSPADELANSAQIYETLDDRRRRKEELAQRKIELRQNASENNEFPAIKQPGFDQNKVYTENETAAKNPVSRESATRISEKQNPSDEK